MVEKCNEHQLPYYFKFAKRGNRDDTAVIYSDTENLMRYIEILREIKQEHPELAEIAKEPPCLTGKIDNWIGYGSEPPETPEGEKQSFNSLRETVLENAIEKEMKKWLVAHKDVKINYDGKDIPIQEYISHKITNAWIEKLAINYKYKYKDETNDDMAKRLGYSFSELASSKFKEKIYSVVSNISQQICNGDIEQVNDVTIMFNNNYKHHLPSSIYERITDELVLEIPKYDSEFTNNIKSAIIKESANYGIDTNNFCFDVKAREALLALDKQMENVSRSKEKEEQANNPQKNNIEAHNKQDDKNKENVRKQELINQIIIAEQKGKELDKKIAEVKSHSPYSHYETKQETYKKKNIKNPEYFQQQAKIENKDNDAKEDKGKKDKEDFTRIIKADIKNNANKITFESTKKENIINDYIEEEER